MIGLVITGGQTGADLGAWRAAKDAGLKTGGFMPHGFLTEKGLKPEYESDFGAQTCAGAGYDYRRRTIDNVAWADVVVWFGESWSPGGQLTANKAREFGKPLFTAFDGYPPYDAKLEHPWATIVEWIVDLETVRPIILMVAGNRESRNYGIEKFTYDTMTAVFKELGLRVPA